MNLLAQASAFAIPLPAACARLAILDTPYVVMNNKKSIPRTGAKDINRYAEWDDMTVSAYARMLKLAARDLYRVMADGSTVYLFSSIELYHIAKAIFKKAGFYYRLPNIWHKTNPAPKVRVVCPQSSVEVFAMFTNGKAPFNANGGKCHNHYEYPIPHYTVRIHPTQKPIGLMEELITRSSNEGDLVIDTFCGSGVGIAAKKLNRRSFCADLYAGEASPVLPLALKWAGGNV